MSNFKRYATSRLEEVRRIATDAAVGLAQCATEGDISRLEALVNSDHPAVAATARMALDLLQQDPVPDPVPDSPVDPDEVPS